METLEDFKKAKEALVEIRHFVKAYYLDKDIDPMRAKGLNELIIEYAQKISFFHFFDDNDNDVLLGGYFSLKQEKDPNSSEGVDIFIVIRKNGLAEMVFKQQDPFSSTSLAMARGGVFTAVQTLEYFGHYGSSDEILGFVDKFISLIIF